MVQMLEKAPTHIPGLDEILAGGLPRGRTTLIRGESGSGKTVLALEFLYRGGLAGEPGIFIGFEERLEHLQEYAATLGWDLPALREENRLFLLGGHIQPDTLLSGEFSLKGLLAAAAGKSKEMGAEAQRLDWEIQAKELELQRLVHQREERAENLARRVALRGARPPAPARALVSPDQPEE